MYGPILFSSYPEARSSFQSYERRMRFIEQANVEERLRALEETALFGGAAATAAAPGSGATAPDALESFAGSRRTAVGRAQLLANGW